MASKKWNTKGWQGEGMMTVAGVLAETNSCNTSKGWRDPKHPTSPAEQVALIHSELSELLEDYRNGHKLDEIYYEKKPHKRGESKPVPKPCGIPIELADVVIRCADFATRYGIDLENALTLKFAYNRTRPVRHGGKRI